MNMITPPPLPAAKSGGWLSRNWVWVVILGFLLFVTCIAGGVFGLLAIMKSSDAYTGAVARASSNQAVVGALGSPVKEGIFFTGNISEGNSSGKANLMIPLHGPKGKGSLFVLATRSEGEWDFDKLVLKVEGSGQRIDVLDTNELPVTKSDASTHRTEK